MLSSLCITSVLTILLFSLPTYPFSCAFTAGSISYDLSPLTGLWDVRKLIPTPPTETEIIVHMDLCGEEGVHPRPDGPPNRDQVSEINLSSLVIMTYLFILAFLGTLAPTP